MCLPKEEAPKLLEDYMIDKDDTVKEIREAVKAYKEDTTESKVVADVTPTEENETPEKTKEEKAVKASENGYEPEESPASLELKDVLLLNYFNAMAQEEVTRVFNYMKKQKIGDVIALEGVIKAWK